MASIRTFTLLLVSLGLALLMGSGIAIWSNNSLTERVQSVQPVQPVATHVVRDSWMDAARMGAPVYRTQSGPPSLPLLPAGKAIVISDGGYAFATDDLAEVGRWYGLLTYPALNMTAFPSVRYVYEVESVELVADTEGRKVLAVSIHEARTGCELPSCDPVTQLPNYDRRYVVKPANAVVMAAGGKHA
jgi:hypothetical protein